MTVESVGILDTGIDLDTPGMTNLIDTVDCTGSLVATQRPAVRVAHGIHVDLLLGQITAAPGRSDVVVAV